MNKQLQWKFLVVIAVIALSVYGIMKYGIQLGLDLKGGTSFLLKMDVSKIDSSGRGQAVRQAIEIIGRRINRFGVTEPIIQQVGEDRILVQIPGLKEVDRQEARRTVEQAAYLEFLLVHQDNDKLQADALSNPRFRPPLGYTNLTETTTREGRTVTRSYFCKLKPEQGLTGKYVERAWVAYDEIGRPYISLTMNKEGAGIFGRVTSANVGRQLAIVIDGQLQSAPVINDAIV
jgi:SecD/SecF fusion protein